MTTPPLTLGDHLSVQRLGYSHHGLYVGDGQVIHYQGPFANDGQTGQIVLSVLDDFHGEQSLQVVSHPSCPFSPEECVARAFSRLGEQDYHLLFNNCEHFVLWCIEDRHSSPQVNYATTALAATGSQLLKSSQGSQAITSGLMGVSVSLASAPATSGTILSVTAVSAPAWAPLAVGVAVAYGTHRLFKWLTDD
ncbi:lecithin retinol acyltransferase family protein [Aeromonas rivipollensis]|uniref:Lecithin retinol acyltransferase family protein n=1 Tax=Aeromonas rivipollensis TaxID=948519 RepID=A0AAW9YB35_9GAMM|nr:lecithin retinol acyltransferase family protein [Aeromonas rivipollensis]NEX74999.1 lecithin retinol acyltransferase family protein [Aeromonas rivipollensis]